MAAMPSDTPVRDQPANDPPATLELSDDETLVLSLYDKLRGIRLEKAILKSLLTKTDPPSTVNVAVLQKQLLEARSAYVLRNEVVDSVLTVNPVLRAVHGATQASPIERDLLPAIEQRDEASKQVARAASVRRECLDESMAIAVECRQLEKQNVELAAQVFTLVDALKATNDATISGTDPADDATALAEQEQLKADVKTSRQRWKLIKGTAGGIVVGSGVDWSREQALCDIVLDPE
ncbi:hypothetical protein SEPCBS57363_004203 [Sporothrix epigloea]|uniref:Centromere protein H C-terminal domain-containing protein n=1 Tax=Sporothrix epigloea TaxID=1892477 RepID=A0ABP0DQZ2_9PEZI